MMASVKELAPPKASYRQIKRLIAHTFPDIHWEVYSWHKYTGRPDVWEEGKTVLIHAGFVDGWAYNLPAYQAPEGDEQAVIDALEAKITAWWQERNPGLVRRVYRSVSALLSSLSKEGNEP